jgi:HK97 family phage prohead protease
MLFQHDPAEPIGVWLELTEDLRGLYARGRLIPEVMRARELLERLKAGTADGLSIGFRAVKARMTRGKRRARSWRRTCEISRHFSDARRPRQSVKGRASC